MRVNLAGVEVILDLLEKLERAQIERDLIARQHAEMEAYFREVLERMGAKFT